jgi:hypothetical protein
MKMGDLVNLWDVAAFGERGEPSARAALLRVASAMTAAEGEIERVLIGRQKLEGEMSKVADVKRDLQDRIKLEAASLVAAMKSSAQWALGQFGNRATRKTEELLGASSIQTAIGEQALAEAAEELQRLEERRERLRVAKAGIIKEVVREALQEALLADYGVILERLQETTARLKGIERYLTPPGHDYRPGATRLSVLVRASRATDPIWRLPSRRARCRKSRPFCTPSPPLLSTTLDRLHPNSPSSTPAQILRPRTTC